MPSKVPPPDVDGGSGSPTGGATGGGGTPGTPTGTSGGTAVPGENGGVIGSTYFLFSPVQDITGNCWFGFFDISSYDDPKDSSEYDFRVEDIEPSQEPTVNWIILDYRDLGVAQITVTLKAVSGQGVLLSNSATVQIGNVSPTNVILTTRIGLAITGYRPQLIITRAAGGGPVSITRATIQGEVS